MREYVCVCVCVFVYVLRFYLLPVLRFIPIIYTNLRRIVAICEQQAALAGYFMYALGLRRIEAASTTNRRWARLLD